MLSGCGKEHVELVQTNILDDFDGDGNYDGADTLCFLDKNYHEKISNQFSKNHKSLKSKLKNKIKKTKSNKLSLTPKPQQTPDTQSPKTKSKNLLTKNSCPFSINNHSHKHPQFHPIPITSPLQHIPYPYPFHHLQNYMIRIPNYSQPQNINQDHNHNPTQRFIQNSKTSKNFTKFRQDPINYNKNNHHHQYDSNQNSEEMSKKYKTEICKNFEMTQQCEWGDMVLYDDIFN